MLTYYNMEYWYDPQHTGALRVIDYEKKRIYGSDPKEPYWCVSFDVVRNGTILVNFTNKKTHHGKKMLITKYEDRNMTLHWEDGNKWMRMKQDPTILLSKLN